jgi:hypothetical protein
LLFGFSGFSGGDGEAGGPDTGASAADAGNEPDSSALEDSGRVDANPVADSGDASTGPDVLDASAVDASSDASEGGDGVTPGGITLVQQAGSHFTTAVTGSQDSETFSSPTTTGNTIIVLGFWFELGFSASVTDSLGNTYSSTAVVTNPQQAALQIFYVARSAGGPNTVTLSMSAGFNSYLGLAIFEYAGLAASNVLEGSAGQYAPTATSAASTPPMATSSSSSLLLAGFADTNGSGVIAPGPGWTPLVTNSAFYMLAEAMVVPATLAVAASATLPASDDRWVSLVAAFRAGP